MQAWNDAARLADRKWDKVMDEVWPAAQTEVAAELGTGQPDSIVFAPNTLPQNRYFMIRYRCSLARSAAFVVGI